MPRKRTTERKARGVFEKVSGSGIWWVRYKDADGKYRREKAGTFSTAEKLYSQRKNDATAGTKLRQNLRHRAPTFGKLADAVIPYSDDRHKDTRNVRQRINVLKNAFGDLIAEDITPSQIDAWLTSLKRQPATLNRYRSTMSLAYRLAIRDCLISNNPARLVGQRKEQNGRVRFLSDDERKRLAEAVLGTAPERLPELTISLGTGMRRSEQYGLTWRYVDFERREVNLRDTKNGTPRTIPMSQSVLDAFRAIHASALDTSADARVFTTAYGKWFATALSKAKITDYRWHDNRHTFCSRLAMAGQSMKIVQQLAGHKTITMSARYMHLGETTLRSAVDSIG